MASGARPFRFHKALPAEEAVIAHCLVKPDRVRQITASISREDLAEPFHRQVLGAMLVMTDEGRTPSIEAVSAAIGDQELAPGVTCRGYLTSLVRGSAAFAIPWEDAVESLIDARHRRQAGLIASALASGADLATNVGEAVAKATIDLDELTSSLRKGRALRYSAAGAGNSALAHLDAPANPFPTTGFTDLDELLGGWPLGELSILAGRPGMGKSAFATSSVLRAAKAGVGTLLFSLEMRDWQLGARMLTDLAYANASAIHYEDLVRRRIDASQRRRLDEAAARLAELPLQIEEQRGLSIADLRAAVRKAANAGEKAARPLQLVVVDHIGLLKPSGNYPGNRVREVGEFCDGLASIAKEADVAVLGLCQLNREVERRENKRPMQADLRDSGEIEEMASVIGFVYRAAYYLERSRHLPKGETPEELQQAAELEAARVGMLEKFRHVLDLQVAKNRNGRVGQVKLFVDMGANAVRNAEFAHRRSDGGVATAHVG
jgi:replicative DNA helicase